MNIYVCIEQVPDADARIQLNADSTGIATEGVKWVLSSCDEFAVEEALRLREKNAGSTVTVLSTGPTRVVEAIRAAMAMGADNGIYVETPETADDNLTAKALAGALKNEAKVDIVFTGKGDEDQGTAQVSQLLSEFAGLPCVTLVLSAEYGASSVKCKRAIEGGAFEIVECPLPAVIGVENGINEPRFPSLLKTIKSGKKDVKALQMADVGVGDGDQKTRFKNFRLAPPKRVNKIRGGPVTQAKELVRLLHEEAKVV
jgi:electron transfer flavoprotein beta subunit